MKVDLSPLTARGRLEHLLSKDPRTGWRWMDVYALRRQQEKWTREFFGLVE